MVRTKHPLGVKSYHPDVVKPGTEVGRVFTPRTFTPKDLRAVELLTKLAATQDQIANFFRVNTSTVKGWQQRYPAFRESMKRGGIEADMKVAQSLYKRAVGYSYIEEEYTAIEVNGKKIPLDQMALVKRVKKTLPPDVKAAIHWLRIRQRETWTIVPELLHRHTGNVGHLHMKLQEIPVKELSTESRALLFEITQK